MAHQIPLEVFLPLLRIASIFIGGLLVYWEIQYKIGNAPLGKESDANWEGRGIYSNMRAAWRIDRNPPGNLLLGLLPYPVMLFMLPEFWIFIGIALITSAMLSSDSLSYITLILLAAGLLRIGIFRLTDYAPNKHKFLVGNKVFELIGQNGILTTDITPKNSGSVRMENSIFKNDVMDCIADETINAGEEVKVLEVDCGLLKVAKAAKTS